MKLDIDHLRSWIGRSEVLADVATAAPPKALAATLDRTDAPAAADALPPCWHWLYFLPMARQSEIGADGHPLRGGFLPPVPLPRRMWAGSRIEFRAPLRVGQSLSRSSCIEDVRLKIGRSGPLVFVNVRHEIRAEGTLAVVDRHDIVYRDLPQAGEPAATGVPAREDAQWTRRIEPDDVLLFRYSALTFNGHRIHYDRRYVTGVEGYPGLVVHGPLIATLLLDLLRRELPAATVTHFAFKAVKPIFDVAPFHVCGRREDDRTVQLWACTPEGHLAMEASATLGLNEEQAMYNEADANPEIRDAVRQQCCPFPDEYFRKVDARSAYPEAFVDSLMAAGWLAANMCMQSYGGFGFANEYDFEPNFRETRLYQVAPISTNLIHACVAEHILGLPRSS